MKSLIANLKEWWRDLPLWQRRVWQINVVIICLLLTPKLYGWLEFKLEARPAHCTDRICGHVCIVPYIHGTDEYPSSCRISGFGRVTEPLEEARPNGLCPAGAFYQAYLPYGNYRVYVRCGEYEGILRFGVSSEGLNKHFVPVAETQKLPQ
ncbi:hypothetical protein JXD20_01505 [Candidatus Peregrinibacteria bacterium]|nr:hypothetical protein [Candidatus Peregrinibacteria bacterium]